MARLNQATRLRVKDQIPPVQCKATANSTGKRCLHSAIVGAVVCQTHGGMASQVRAAAEQRVTLAEALKTAPKRQPWEVLEEAAHIADLLMQDARLDIEHGRFTPAALDKLVAALDRAHRLSTTNVHAGLAERRQRFAEGQADQMHQVFTRVLAGLGLSQEQKALVPGLLKREIEGVLVARRQEIAA